MIDLVLGGVIVIAINVLIWVFLFGKRTGKVNNRLSVIEEKLSNPQVLPQCTEIFTEIKEKLSYLAGNVETILLVIKENQKNVERKRTSRTKK